MLTMTASESATAEDMSNIVALEHVNLQVPDQSLATLFYIVGLGFTRDPYMNVGVTNMWINIGDQQLHLPTGKHQVLRGHTGLVIRDLQSLKERLASVEDSLKGTAFAWTDRGDHVAVTSPWGNLYRCFAPGKYGSMVLGIPYVEFSVPSGAAAGIQRFYERIMGAPARVVSDADGTAAHVEVGANQELVFREGDAAAEYDGHHIAVYIANFSGPFRFLQARNLITEDIRNHQFRFQEIVDPDSGESLYSLEHEVRSSRHPFYLRELTNREPEHPLTPIGGRVRH